MDLMEVENFVPCFKAQIGLLKHKKRKCSREKFPDETSLKDHLLALSRAVEFDLKNIDPLRIACKLYIFAVFAVKILNSLKEDIFPQCIDNRKRDLTSEIAPVNDIKSSAIGIW